MQRSLERSPAATTIAYLAVYLLLAWASDIRALYALGITPWSPQSGVSLAYLLRFGMRGLPAVVIATTAAEVLLRHAPGTAPVTFLGALWIAGSFVAVAALLRRITVPDGVTTAAVAARLAATCAGGVLVTATGFVLLNLLAGSIPGDEAVPAATRFWVGNLNGILTITPLLLGAAPWNAGLRQSPGPLGDLVARLLVVALTLVVVFLLPATDQLRFFYLLFVPVVWIASRWQWRGVLLAVLVIQSGLLIVAETRIPTARFIDLQFFLLVLTLTGVLLGFVVAERAAALRTMAAREAEQRALLAMAPDAILVTDARGVIRVANAAADRLFGTQDRGAIGHRADELIGELRLEPQEGRATLSGRRTHGDEFPAEIAWSRLPGTAESGFLVIVRDVSERRRAEEQLREQDAALASAMRFAVAGELASALAHELNQPITALISYLRACEILVAPGGDAARLEATLDKSVREAIRASNVLHRLRDFYQGAAPKHEPVQLPVLCDTVLAAFKDRLRRADVSVRSDIDPSVPAIAADATHLEIVLHNLLANALEAVTRSPAGERRIALEVTHDSTSVTLRVEDSGPGVAPTVQRNLFDPFVTDKAHGMGLGLAISQSLVRARGGDLALEPARALGGACFVVSLPIQFPSDTAAG